MKLDAAEKLARRLMTEHGLHEPLWLFRFDKGSTRFGYCEWRPWNNCISLSRNLTLANNDEAIIIDVILHEIAHALVGMGHAHDRVWQAKARELGARPEPYYDADKVVPHAPWWLECWRCKRQYPKAKRTRTNYACQRCSREVSGKKYDPRFILKWIPNEEQLTFSRRPQSGVTKRVWDIADDLTSQLGRVPERAIVLKECILQRINPATAQVQYAKWFRNLSEEKSNAKQ